jgi:hypothetical protein
MMVLQMLFGMTSNQVSSYLRFGRRLLIVLLVNEPDAAIRLPSVHNIREYQEVIERRHPLLRDVWCSMDGLKIYLQQAGCQLIQGMFYNGWLHDHYVSGIFVFCPDGTIACCCYNVPGSVHDSMIAEHGGVYDKLEQVHNETGGLVTGDSAFSKVKYNFIIKSGTADPLLDSPEDYAKNKEATSMRQTAEWGMRGLQSSFPRLKDRLIYEEYGERRVILKVLILLYNLRARKVGINQIKNTYMPALELDANELFMRK